MSTSTDFVNGRRLERKSDPSSTVRGLLAATPLFILIAAVRAARRRAQPA